MSQFTSVVMGNESLLVECSERMLSRGHQISAVVTRNPAVAEWARGKGVAVFSPGAGLVDHLRGIRFDWLLSIANLSVIPQAVLKMATKGAVNFHDGPLPRHAGLNAPVWALIEGDQQHGITWHMIEDGVDTGDILVQRSFAITAADTALTLNTKCYEAAIDSFGDLLTALEADTPDRRRQDPEQRTYHARTDRPAGGGLLDGSMTAAQGARMIRALDHGTYWNPLCLPKISVGGTLYAVGGAQPRDCDGTPGSLLDIGADGVTVAMADTGLHLTDLRDLSGAKIAADELFDPDMRLDAGQGDLDTLLEPVFRADGFWRARMADYDRAALPGVRDNVDSADSGTDSPFETRAMPDIGLEHIVAWTSHLVEGPCDIALRHAALQALEATGQVAAWVPLRIAATGTLDAVATRLETELAMLTAKSGFALDLHLRDPGQNRPMAPDLAVSLGAGPVVGSALTVELGESNKVYIDTGRIDPALADLLIDRLAMLASQPGDVAIDDLPRLSDVERSLVLEGFNTTANDQVSDVTMHRAFEAQVAATPNATALVFEDQRLTYAQLNARANRAAHVLQGMGVKPDMIVGLCTRRSVDMVVGALAILKAGGAYLPMDPGYPSDRLEHFVADSGAAILVTQSGVTLPDHEAQVLMLDDDCRIDAASDANLADTSEPGDLAYLIYTSGSTGKPKGVMIEHRNVANFYAGMDQRVAHDPAGTWLAVTSLSFDISVLELFYATARGFKVVLSNDDDRGLISNGPVRSRQAMDFSIYYWGNDGGTGRDKYRLLLEGAKFADDNGFCAVWTPERHFHAFGGPYPNPSVTGAAVASVTKNIGVRAGSCVAPLHHPARVAEEWAVIDNLTDGRAGIAFASGWQPDDFILRPENTPPENKAALLRDIDTVRRLWRGEAVGFPRKDGEVHEVVTQPRPVSRDLPIWVTTAGNPQTWKDAGALGANVLTHLLGQSIEEVGGKIRLYHEALRAAGHDPADFTVTLMLHTCLADSRDEAREIAREPMKDYLRSAAGLIKQYAWAFPAFKKPDGVKNPFELDLGSLSEAELEGILDFAFERYFNDSGLFGTVEDALTRTEDLKRIGVTEIACLIDYGIEVDTVLAGLHLLARVVAGANQTCEPAADDYSIAAQLIRHEVTHLQCTPSMARMIALNDEARMALGTVEHLMLGGEPLPGALIQEFSDISDARILNMYGPTETTIWSSTEDVATSEGIVNIGRPLANQCMYVLDDAHQPVPVGIPGELWIGGAGVARGYWNRPDLTADRFVQNPFHPGRMYRTGDLVRRRADGRMDFIGRVDHQIKLRGYRIELGEIEAVLEAQAGVTQAVVSAREDTPGDMRLVGYYTGPAVLDAAQLRDAMGQDLPSFMVPGKFMRLNSFPLTPNKKVDRTALPAPVVVTQKPMPLAAVAPRAKSAAASDLQSRIATIWRRTLGVQDITANDSFFDLGGHSLLAVQCHRALRQELGAQALSITDIFQFPVLGDLTARIAGMITPEPEQPSAAPKANDRAQTRAQAIARRRAMRAKRRA
ncbi:MAG: LLM class flavin-dependent oxidoreductase [Rhodobacteraceae bacterium]|nr:LLM class flavin-dependent oxidoreductase [Paracoccaceae bacterium]